MKNFLKGLMVGLLVVQMVASVAYAATLNFVQTPSTALYASMSASATSMRITPYPKDLNGTKLTMTDFGTTPTVTVDPKKTNYEEIVSFTGITDNGDNTATLTGLSRNLLAKSPYTTPGTGKTHGAGALVVFSNNPQMYARLAALENTESISGTWTFATTPIITNNPINNTDAANKQYVDGVAVAGAPNANETTKGIIELGTAIETASSTTLGSTAAALVPQSKNATSSPLRGCDGTSVAGALCLVVARNDGKIHPNFIATSSTDAYRFGGTVAFSGATSLPSTLTINGAATTFPGNNGVASSTVLSNDASGNVSWVTQGNRILSLQTGNFLTTNSASTTLITYTMPANTFGQNKKLRIEASIFMGTGGGNCYYGIDFGNGSATTSVATGLLGTSGEIGSIQGSIFATSTTAEVSNFQSWTQDTGISGVVTPVQVYSGAPYLVTYSRPTVTLTNQSYISFIAVTTSSRQCSFSGESIELLSQ